MKKIQRKTLHSSDRVEFGFDDSYKLLFLYDDDEIGRLLQQMQTGQSLVTGGTNLGKLRAMVEVARTLQNSFATNEVLAAVVDAALTITNTTRGYLILRNDGHLKVRVARDQSGRPIEGAPLIDLAVLEAALARRRDFPDRLGAASRWPDGCHRAARPSPVRQCGGDPCGLDRR